MPSTAKYQWMTVLVGFLGVPFLVSLAAVFAAAPFEAAWVKLAVGFVMAVVVAFPTWFNRGRRENGPDRWLPALLPVAAVPATFLLFWVVTFGVTDSVGNALNVFALPAFGYLILSVVVLWAGPSLLVPAVLVTVLVASVAGFVLGARRRLPSGNHALIGVVAACLALVAVAGVQVAQYATRTVTFADDPSMSDEVQLWEYLPFEADNRLVKPDVPATLRITSDFPVLDGATALYPVYAAIGQATYVPPVAGGAIEEGFADRHFPCSTTSEAYEGLIYRQADAIFVAQPSKGQLAKAKAAGVELKVTPIGREAFIFFVNTDNPVTDLSLDQVRDIYSKRITNWKQVGGRDELIIAFQRPDDSGSQTAMLAMVMKDRAIAPPMKEERISGMGGIIDEVAGYRDVSGAIGYSFRWYATVMNSNPDIRLLTIDGVEPTAANIRNGSYPLTGQVNVVTAGSTNPNVQKLLDWTRSAEGQALIEKTGYVGR